MNVRLPRFTLFLAALALASTAACSTTSLVGSGTAKTELRAIEAVRGLELLLPARVELTQGATESLAITADDNVLPEIESRVERGVLKLAFRGPLNLRTSTPIRIALSVKAMESITISGSGDVHSGPIRSEKLAITINGSGDAVLGSFDGERLEASIRGSGDVSAASGRVGSLEVSIAGSGDVKVSGLQADRVKVGIAGSGDARVWARETLTVRVAGSGDVRYFGDPEVDKAILGSGRVKRSGPAPG
jgi:hypothetical protein